MAYIYDNFKNGFVRSEIVRMEGKLIPSKKQGWKFNWKNSMQSGGRAYVLHVNGNAAEGALLLTENNGVMFMELLEVAPHNFGKEKRYEHVAGCLIAYACKESFKMKADYKGYLVFVSKTSLMKMYMEKYGAEIAVGQKMFIAPQQGERLINQYLFRKI